MSESIRNTVVTIMPLRGPRSAYDMHKVLTSVAPSRRLLWAQPVPDLVMIRSDELPDWGAIPGATNCTTSSSTIPMDGAEVTWALIANPTRVDASGVPRDAAGRSLERGKRIPLVGADVEVWAARKLAPAMDIGSVEHRLLAPATGNRITITRYAICGTGTVTDSAALADLMRDGVGPGKGLGCGLLQVSVGGQ